MVLNLRPEKVALAQTVRRVTKCCAPEVSVFPADAVREENNSVAGLKKNCQVLESTYQELTGSSIFDDLFEMCYCVAMY